MPGSGAAAGAPAGAAPASVAGAFAAAAPLVFVPASAAPAGAAASAGGAAVTVVNLDLGIGAPPKYCAYSIIEAIRTAAPNTAVVALSWYGGTGAELALSDEFHHNRITIRSSQVGGIAPELSATHSLSRRVEQIMDWFGELELDRLLTKFIPFDEASFAYDLIDLRGEEAIQVVLRYDG